jgi:hypothetical protein
VLVEQGLAGFAILLFFLAAVFRHLHANLTVTSSRFPCLLPCGVYLLLIAMFSGDLDDDRFVWFWCGLTLGACTLARRASGKSLDLRGKSGACGFSTQSSFGD